jgi:hypothetical protein
LLLVLIALSVNFFLGIEEGEYLFNLREMQTALSHFNKIPAIGKNYHVSQTQLFFFAGSVLVFGREQLPL